MSSEASRMQRPECKEKGFEMILGIMKLMQSLLILKQLQPLAISLSRTGPVNSPSWIGEDPTPPG